MSTDREMEWLERIETGACPRCGQQVEQAVQRGRCVWGRPCGHRLFQGDADGYNLILSRRPT